MTHEIRGWDNKRGRLGMACSGGGGEICGLNNEKHPSKRAPEKQEFLQTSSPNQESLSVSSLVRLGF